MKKQYRVAGVQASVAKFLDLDATVEKGVKIIEEAASNGAELVVFPEAYFPGYPYWIWIDGPGYDGFKFWKRLRDNSLEEGGPALAKLAKAARDNNIFVCASGTEKDRGSLYLTQFWFVCLTVIKSTATAFLSVQNTARSSNRVPKDAENEEAKQVGSFSRGGSDGRGDGVAPDVEHFQPPTYRCVWVANPGSVPGVFACHAGRVLRGFSCG